MVTLMVAMDDERGIGNAGSIPWHYPEDLRLFKKVTSLDNGDGRHPVVIMGRKTKESLPIFPLPGRENVVLSRAGPDLREVLQTYRKKPDVGRITVIGGGDIYRQCIQENLCEYVYVSHIPGTHDCDLFFPSLSSSHYTKMGEWPLGRIKRSLFCVFSNGENSPGPPLLSESEGPNPREPPVSRHGQ